METKEEFIKRESDRLLKEAVEMVPMITPKQFPQELKDSLDDINTELDNEKERLITEIAEKVDVDIDDVRIVVEEIGKVIVFDYKMYEELDE